MSGFPSDFASVLAVYSGDCQPRHVIPVTGGGFSGSKVWRLETARGQLCLKRWPAEYPDRRQLRSIHQFLSGVDAAGFHRIPLPIATREGDTVVEHDDHLWELTAWLPGEADQPNQLGTATSPARIQAALTALAEFHRAASMSQKPQPVGFAPGLLQRCEQLSKLTAAGLDELERQTDLRRNVCPGLAERSRQLFKNFRARTAADHSTLKGAAALMTSIQPCIRDIHRDHVLFAGDQVTGIIDFGSMKSDSVACDIARLLGSMAIDEASLWSDGLAAYQRVRPLSDTELRLVEAYDRSAVLLSGFHWLQWIFADGRQFDDRPRVLQRFDLIAQRLSRLAVETTFGS
jgi:Ser/Thr protein kinase RdoA (MazF antagonist)